ncbi:MAG: antibiotic biosynthesis monooxygenase [Candidatus Eremiobacteraeota bacterium]|nr:antibiotic biosynthesis monooxygenase [Candidatus Eremiobacteraeota bacterium]
MNDLEDSVSIGRPALLRSAALAFGALSAAAIAPLPAAAADAGMRKAGIVVIATVKAKPGMEGQLHDVFLSIVGPARADGGNLSYDLVQSVEDPTTFVSIEVWKSSAALQAHLATQPVTDAIAKLGSIVAGPPAIVSYKMVSDPV